MERLPPEIVRFINEHVKSIAQLEALLLLASRPADALTAEQLARELYISGDVMGQLLGEWRQLGLLQASEDATPTYRFAPAEASNVELIKQLAELYAARRVTIVTLIYTQPPGRAQSFADAFKLRKDP